MHTGAITTILGLWFDRQRGLAISLALNGASFGGILITPALVIAIERFGFASAMVGAAAIIAMIVLPAAALWIDRPPVRIGGHPIRGGPSGLDPSQRRYAAPRSGASPGRSRWR